MQYDEEQKIHKVIWERHAEKLYIYTSLMDSQQCSETSPITWKMNNLYKVKMRFLMNAVAWYTRLIGT